jgi:recombinational DNA repair protein RecR
MAKQKLKEALKKYKRQGKWTCEECGKKVKEQRTKRCWDCHVRFFKENWVMVGKDNGKWKGDDVSYTALHNWVRRHKPKIELCEICKKNKATDVSNISGKYKRNIRDYQWICKPCHRIRDGYTNNFKINYISSKLNHKGGNTK